MNTNIQYWSYLTQFFLEWEMFQSCRENRNTHFMFNIFFFLENFVVYDILWKRIVDPERPHYSTAHAHFKLGTYGYKHTLSEYVIALLLAFPLQQCLHKRASVLRYMYVACHVISSCDCGSIGRWHPLSPDLSLYLLPHYHHHVQHHRLSNVTKVLKYTALYSSSFMSSNFTVFLLQ